MKYIAASGGLRDKYLLCNIEALGPRTRGLGDITLLAKKCDIVTEG